ncbi:hypothetical protein [Streptomyces sp. B1I3]|uniref:hypothetical protein n=1 Tax=Streptomyces sp. B1I3 TaxID=3042264 RepID=UPI0027865C32|nr:hypothetical protein [Streptomyces sp. B1I3]MDQ0791761.1 hypothetical protein [Streptomyces sp. B1I3]
MEDRESFPSRQYKLAWGKGRWELREVLRSRVAEMRVLVSTRVDPGGDRAAGQKIKEAALGELDQADDALNHSTNSWRIPGSSLAVAQAHLDMAHSLMLRLASSVEVRALLPGLLSVVREHLSVTDLRRSEVEKMEQHIGPEGALNNRQRELLIDAVGVARQALLRETLRVRSFVSIVYGVFAALTSIAIVVAVLGARYPDVVPLCFGPMDVGIVCPTGDDSVFHFDPGVADLDSAYADVAKSRDYLVVELAGLGAAAVAAAVTLRRINGTAMPYNVPVALALLKLPTGALTAVLGLLLVRGAFVPGLSALDSSAQIIGWAIIFGYSQQLFTRLVDRQGQAVLDAVGGGPSTPQSAPPHDSADGRSVPAVPQEDG